MQLFYCMSMWNYKTPALQLTCFHHSRKTIWTGKGSGSTDHVSIALCLVVNTWMCVCVCLSGMTDSSPLVLRWTVSCQGASICVSHRCHYTYARRLHSVVRCITRLPFINITSTQPQWLKRHHQWPNTASFLLRELERKCVCVGWGGGDGWCNSRTFNVRQTLRSERAVPPSVWSPNDGQAGEPERARLRHDWRAAGFQMWWRGWVGTRGEEMAEKAF